MDAERFDSLAKRLGASATRRTALGGAAGGLLGALGVRPAGIHAAQGGVCVLAFVAAVRVGPSTGQALTPDGGRPGELRGELRFSLSGRGALQDATLALANGVTLPVVGDATGHTLNARIELAPRTALVIVGVGEQEVAACQGAIDGVVTGPEVGDLGDWHAAVSASAGGGRAASADSARGGGAASGNDTRRGASGSRSDRSGRDASGNRAGGNDNDQSQGQGQSQGQDQDAASAATRQTTGSEAASCPAGQTLCADGACHDLAIESGNCGACGTRCPSLSCQNGRCLSEDEADRIGALQLACDDGFTFCDLEEGYCADLLTDSLNCGACGNACVFSDELCQDGVCVADPTESVGGCPAGTRPCGNDCLDVFNDPANCGSCGFVCSAATPVCSGGRCFEAQDVAGQQDANGCGGGLVLCSGQCVDIISDTDNCGDCGILCPVSPEIYDCVGGVCVEPSCDPLTKCGFLCVDLLSDPLACGACDTACAPGQPCQGGVCAAPPACAPGQTNCNGVCFDLSSDPNNCGECGVGCVSGVCNAGECGVAGGGGCLVGLTDCSGTCVDLAFDAANCGGCGVACPSGNQCDAGVCVFAGGGGCLVGLTDCGGVCVDLVSDPANCGGCGVPCSSGTCSGGACASSAASA